MLLVQSFTRLPELLGKEQPRRHVRIMLRWRSIKARLMSDEHETRETPGARSFEERVFASFDSLDARLNGFETRLERLDGRLSALEDKAERRMQDTCPIWEQVNERLGKLETGVQEFRGESKANFRKA